MSKFFFQVKFSKLQLIRMNFIFMFFNVLFLILFIFFKIDLNNFIDFSYETLETSNTFYVFITNFLFLSLKIQICIHIFFSLQSLYFDYLNTNNSFKNFLLNFINRFFRNIKKNK